MRALVIACAASLVFAGAPARAAAPSNDDFAHAIDIASVPRSITVDNTGATTEPGEPYGYCAPIAGTIWFRLRPTRGILIKFDTLGSPTDAVVNMYRGHALDALTSIGSSCGPSGDVSGRIPLAARETYLFQVGGRFYGDEWAAGEIDLHIRRVPVSDTGIARFAVRPAPLRTDAGDVPTGVLRTITVVVANRGPDPSGALYMHVLACPKDPPPSGWIGSCSEAGYEDIANLARGARITWTHTWNGAGAFGDFEFRAELTNDESYDPNTTNNFATTDSYVVVGGIGFGVNGAQ